MKKIKVLSLFDGISCAQVALEALGYSTKCFASEVDKYAIEVTQKNYPETIQVGDVKLFTKDNAFFHNAFGNFDLLIGGSPCQDLSIAKKDRKGLKGERSGLFYEYLRILKETKPKYFLLENVASMPKDAKATITGLLGVEPIMINAALVSAQSRKRLFWTNIPNVEQPEDKGIYLKDILEGKEVPITKHGVEKLKSNTVRTGGRGSGFDNKHNWDAIKVGLPMEKLDKKVGGRIGGWVEDDKKVMAYQSDKKRSTVAEKVYHKGKSKTNAITVAHKPKYYKDGHTRPLTIVECERLQSLPDNYTEGISNAQRYKTLGNAFNVEVVKHILSYMEL